YRKFLAAALRLFPPARATGPVGSQMAVPAGSKLRCIAADAERTWSMRWSAACSTSGSAYDYHLSVRNGEAGRPSLLERLGSASWCQANRTATGFATDCEETTTSLPSILA